MSKRKYFYIVYLLPVVIVFFLSYNHKVPLISLISLYSGLVFFITFIIRFGEQLLIKELILYLISIQFFIVPFLVYYQYNNDFSYAKMISPDKDYFSYVFFAILALAIGFSFAKIKNEKKILDRIFLNIRKYGKRNYIIGIKLVVLGIVIPFIGRFLPASLANVFYVISGFKMIGILYILFSNSKWKYLWIAVVFFDLAVRTIKLGIFYELLIWLIYFSEYYFLQKKLSIRYKFILFTISFFFIFSLQIIKNQYRNIVWSSQVTSGHVQIFANTVTETLFDDEEELFEENNTKAFLSRLNLGWVTSSIIDHVYNKDLYTNGSKILDELPSILLPRFIYPNKKKISGKDLQEDFYQYTGKMLRSGTTINLGALGDAYINFGAIGGTIFMFCFGLLISIFIKKMIKICVKYPTFILWLPLIIFDLIRMKDFYSTLNSLMKNTILVFLCFYFLKSQFFYRGENNKINVPVKT